MTAPRVGILVSGGGSNMEALVRAMQAEGFATPVGVISNIPGAGGLARAERLGLPALTVAHKGLSREAFEDRLDAALRGLDADILCLAGFMRILTPGFVNRWEGRTLNIHPSLLPKYPGLDTHARAIAAGDREAGCTVHLVTPELDAGPILGRARVPILPGDTAATLGARVLAREHELYPAVLRRFVEGKTGVLEL